MYSVRFCVDCFSRELICLGTNIRADLLSLTFLLNSEFFSFPADPILFLLMPDCIDLLIFFPKEIEAIGVLVSTISLSNSKRSLNKGLFIFS